MIVGRHEYKSLSTDPLTANHTVSVGWDLQNKGYYADVDDHALVTSGSIVESIMPTTEIAQIENAILPYLGPEQTRSACRTIERDRWESELQSIRFSVVEYDDRQQTTGTFATGDGSYRYLAAQITGRGTARLIDLTQIPPGVQPGDVVTLQTRDGVLEVSKPRDAAHEVDR